MDIDQKKFELLLHKYRNKLWHPQQKVTNFESAIEWVNQMEMVFFWPIQGIEFPSLWAAVAGERPVTYNDPANHTWDWKDRSLSLKVWYYSKLIRKKATFLSLDMAAHFYALSPNYGDPENDYLEQYQQGHMTMATKNVYEALLENGPMITIDLKKKARLTSAQSESEFNRAIETLQVEMKVLPVGIAQAGAWRYSFIYDLVTSHYPELPLHASKITEQAARSTLASTYLRNVGASNLQTTSRFFGWPLNLTEKTLEKLVEKEICQEVDPQNKLFAHSDLLKNY